MHLDSFALVAPLDTFDLPGLAARLRQAAEAMRNGARRNSCSVTGVTHLIGRDGIPLREYTSIWEAGGLNIHVRLKNDPADRFGRPQASISLYAGAKTLNHVGIAVREPAISAASNVPSNEADARAIASLFIQFALQVERGIAALEAGFKIEPRRFGTPGQQPNLYCPYDPEIAFQQAQEAINTLIVAHHPDMATWPITIDAIPPYGPLTVTSHPQDSAPNRWPILSEEATAKLTPLFPRYSQLRLSQSEETRSYIFEPMVGRPRVPRDLDPVTTMQILSQLPQFEGPVLNPETLAKL